MRPENSRDSFQKSFARASDRCGKAAVRFFIPSEEDGRHAAIVSARELRVADCYSGEAKTKGAEPQQA
jgi:hypothetical protein